MAKNNRRHRRCWRHAEITSLLAALDAYQALCGSRRALSVEQLFQPNLRFFVARLDGAAVACGGVGSRRLRRLKRMYSRL
jgi:hypothetical protein